MNPVDRGVQEIMGAVFGVSPRSIDVSASPETIPTWDSLQQLNLILTLEEHFQIQFTVEEVEVMNNYHSIVTLVSEHIGHDGRGD